ncbi:hypothetical protein [Arthrobacter glacialis]|uniref:Uncharacterized protein n=1 Tax=Arthrobacter glacialis TaxID=1664 RepID=A0A2S3ZZA6_ARTGL|nr:hypothetical protein [Arthrobacter glacialis]POH59940.1 hypothetical protein CVS28_06750 [Arthrobacter glacialis]POH74570.1 hypothetical protein CVS27_04950 [Arthrobacter glacialis]
MTVAAKNFQMWLSHVAGSTSQAAVCRAAGIKRSTLAQQLVRGRVSLATIAAVSRSLDLPVVASLSVFPDLEDLVSGIKAPTTAELLSQISDADLLQEILNRNVAAETGNDPIPVELSPIPHRSSVRAWLDAIDPTDLRQKVARNAAMAPQNLSAQISANRLSAELAIDSARIAGVGLTNGLVATGFLSPAEAGWAAGACASALRGTANSVLASLAAERLEALSRVLRRSEDDTAAARNVWEYLG